MVTIARISWTTPECWWHQSDCRMTFWVRGNYVRALTDNQAAASICTARMAKYSNTTIDDALRTATKEMGYSDLRPKQEEVVRNFMRGRDVFVSLPTGSGKSLCYSVLRVLEFLTRCEKYKLGR